MRQIRSVSLTSYLDVAHFVGIDGHQLLASAGILPGALDDPETRLPATSAIRLLERSAEASGCDSFGILMAQCRSFASLGPASLLLQHVDTVADVLAAMSASSRSFSDVLVVAVERSDDVALITCDVAPPYGRPQATDLTIALGVLALRGASGGRWAPEAVHFAHERPRNIRAFETFFSAPLQFDSHFNGFSCPVSMLDIPLPLADREMAQNARHLLSFRTLPEIAEPLLSHVKRSIILLLPEGRASLTNVAKNVGLSGRVLQRRLEAHGLTFATMISGTRRDLARQYLSSSGMQVREVAEQLGYSSATSFARSFAREHGVSPRSWRNAQRQAERRPSPIWKV